MSRLEPYLGVLAAIALAFIVSNVPGDAWNPVTPLTETNASSTIAVISNITLPPLTFPTISTSTSSTVQKKSPPISKTEHASTVPATSAAAPAHLPPVYSSADLNTAAATLRAALVNIICYSSGGGSLHSISGSGIIIDPKGIILTNAHIAQYFLLRDRGVSCTVRSGSPAVNRYKAALIYIPPPWIRANANVLTTQNPTGTGEQDFALLAITNSGEGAASPVAYSSIALATDPPFAGTPVVIASYGAQFLESAQVQSALFPTVVFGSVKDVYTFGTNTIDVLALGGSAAAQEGSSGGGVSGGADTLLGTITTSTVEGNTATRSLDAITASYIRAAYASETGSPIDTLLAESPANSVANFATQSSVLEAILTAQLP